MRAVARREQRSREDVAPTSAPAAPVADPGLSHLAVPGLAQPTTLRRLPAGSPVIRRFDVGTWPAEKWQAVKDACDVFAHTDPKLVGKIVDGWREKTAGDPLAKRDLGKGVEGTGSATAGGGIGAWGGRSEKVKTDLGVDAAGKDLGQAYEVMLDAGVVAGAELTATGELEKAFGKGVVANAKANVRAFGGVYAKAQAMGYVRKGTAWWDVGAGGRGRAEAMAGAKASGAVSISLTANELSGLGIEIGADGELLAGAKVEAEGEAVLDFRAREIALGGKASAFAGARAEGRVSGTVKLYGRKALGATIKGSVTAGAGAEAEFGFKLSRGVLKLNLGAESTVGLGGGVGGDVNIDFKPIAVFVVRHVQQALWSASNKTSGEVAAKLADPTSVEPKLAADLRKYTTHKVNQLTRNRADEYVKIEKVQQYVDTHLPRHFVKTHPNKANVDAFIKRVVEQECSWPSSGIGVEVVVVDGKLTSLTLDPPDAVKQLKSGTTGTGPSTKPRKSISGIGSSAQGPWG